MRRLWMICLFMGLLIQAPAQTTKKSQQPTAATTVKSGSAANAAGRKNAGRKNGATRRAAPKTTDKNNSRGNSRKDRQPSVTSLQNEQKQLHRDTEAKKRRKDIVEQGVKQGMQSLLILNNEIDQKRRVIDTIKFDIVTLDKNIAFLKSQMDTLNKQLNERKQRYMKSLRFMHRNRSVQNQMLFVFSADNFNQMYRRMRFTRDYATYQRAQGEAVKQKQEQVEQKQKEVAQAVQEKKTLLNRGEYEQQQLESKQNQQKMQVDQLQKEQRTLAAVIEQQQRKERELNEYIDRLIAEEAERAKARAEAEAQKKAAAEAAKKKQQELARKRAAAEAARKENQRRIAEAKAAEEKAKAEARAAARKSAQERAAARRKAQLAESKRKRAERKAEEENKARERDIAKTKRSAEEIFSEPAADKKLTGGFEQNRGRLPIPLTGAYRIIKSFGTNRIEGLKNVRIDSRGVFFKGQSGAQARSVFDGEVTAVFPIGNTHLVMVRHGNYISVYCNLASVNVRRGQRVKARQALGAIGGDGVMQFQLRNWRTKQPLNPANWLGR